MGYRDLWTLDAILNGSKSVTTARMDHGTADGSSLRTSFCYARNEFLIFDCLNCVHWLCPELVPLFSRPCSWFFSERTPLPPPHRGCRCRLSGK